MPDHSPARASADRGVVPDADSTTGRNDAPESAAGKAGTADGGRTVAAGTAARSARQAERSDCPGDRIRAEALVDCSADVIRDEALAGFVNWDEALSAADRAGSVRMTAALRAPESGRPTCTICEFALAPSSSIPGTKYLQVPARCYTQRI
jgi:hypothetical protein